MNQRFILDITWRSIIKVIILGIVLYFLFYLRNILAFFVAALVISIMFEPLVDFFYKRKIPRLISVAVVYLVFLGVFIITSALFLPFFFEELELFFHDLRKLPELLDPNLIENGLFQHIAPYIEPFLNTLRDKIAEKDPLVIITSVIKAVISMSFIIVLSIFFSLENKGVKKFLKLAFPKKYEYSITRIWEKCSKNITDWFGIRLISCLFIGTTTLLALLLMGSPHPFTLSLIAAIFNFIPYIGPLLSGFFIAIVLFTHSPFLAIIFIGIFIILQFLENNVFSIFLAKKAMKTPSSIVLLSIAIGATIWGVLGAILIVPLFAMLFNFLKEFLEKRKLAENQEPKFFLRQEQAKTSR